MYYKNFKGNKISGLGLGSLRLPAIPGDKNRIDRQKAQAIIDQVMSSGIDYFDTAFTYHNGDSERFLGEALSHYPRASYYLATKFYVAVGTDIEYVFEEQLKRCQTDYFDFYLLHGMQEQYIDQYMDPEKDYMGYLLRQKRAGRIRYLGFSSHAAPEALERFVSWYPDFDMALIQLNYLDWTLLDGKRQYEILTEHGIPVWVMEPLKGGRLVTLNDKAEQILLETSPEQSVPSWSFRHLMGLDNVYCILSGMASPGEVLENASFFREGNHLSDQEAAALQKAVDAFRDDFGIPCSACRYCCPVCPAGLDIPLLLQGFNELTLSGDTWKISGLSQTAGPDACLQCRACAKRCPQKIDIPAVMKAYANRSVIDKTQYPAHRQS